MADSVAPDNGERNSQIRQHYASGLSYDDIASLMGLSVGVVAGVLHRSGAKNRGGRYLPRIEMLGQQYGHLTVIDDSMKAARGGRPVLCRCVCGREQLFLATNIRSGKSKSCGCQANGRGRPRKAA